MMNIRNILALAGTLAAASRSAGAASPPPVLTPWQTKFHATNKPTAAAAAARARPALLSVFSDPALSPLLATFGLHSLAALSAEELLAKFEDELQFSEVTHGFQASVGAMASHDGGQCESNCGDVDLAVEAKADATYMHNLWELPVLGERCTPDGNGTEGSGDCFTEGWVRGCDVAETGAFCAAEGRGLCFPSFTRSIPHGVEGSGPEPWPRDWQEAVERPVYNAVNFHRTDHGIGQFGSISVVLNRSYSDPMTFLVPCDSGDYEGGCNVSYRPPPPPPCSDSTNATTCNASKGSCAWSPTGHPHQCVPKGHGGGGGPGDPRNDLPPVCEAFWLHHHSYVNGTISETFTGPNASAHCCAACGKNNSFDCDGWRIEGTGISGSCVTFKKGTTTELSNPTTAIVSASAGTAGWHHRENNCSAWEPLVGGDGKGAELGTFDDFEHTLLSMLYYNNQTSPVNNLANLLAATFLPWNMSNTQSYLPCPAPCPPASFFDEELWYWEANTAGALNYPDAIQLVVGSFGELFGTDLGAQLQAWCIRWRWPLVWTPGTHGGHHFGMPPGAGLPPSRLLDPVVLAKSRAGTNLTVPSAAATDFEKTWALVNRTLDGPTPRNLTQADFDGWYKNLAAAMPSVLKLEPMRSGACGPEAVGRCVGTTVGGDCVCYQEK
jgi:hypothetical protein